MGTFRPKKHRRPHFRKPAGPGAAPGTVIIDPEAPHPEVEVFQYSAESLSERKIHDVAEIAKFVGAPGVVWINVEGLGSERMLRGIAELFHLHPLALEDVVNVHQRAKVDRFGEYLFITARMPKSNDHLKTEQVSLFVGRGFVITFLEDPGDCFEAVRRRLRESDGLIRKRGADYLAYALLDAAVDAYFPLLERFGEALEELEDTVVVTPTPGIIGRVHDAKHDLRMLRRVIWPLREAMNELAREGSTIVTEETRLYFRDLYDHTVQIIDLVETYREMGADLTDLYLSSLSNRMNEIMRVLTVIATIFMPLSFIVGIYGMNFNTAVSPWNMPELNWYFGYPMALGLVATTAGVMLVYFHRRGWLGKQLTLDEQVRADRDQHEHHGPGSG